MGDTKWRFSYNSKALEYEKFSNFEDSKNEVVSFLSENLDLSKLRALEVGCGTGRYTPFLANLLKHLIASDASKNMLDLCKNKCTKCKNIDLFVCDAIKLPFEDNYFDLVFASWAISSMGKIENQKIAIQEIKRVLKKDGIIILIENHWNSDFVKLLGENPIYENSKVAQIQSIEPFNIIKIIESPLMFENFEDAKKIILSAIRTAKLDNLNKTGKVTINHKIAILSNKNI